LFIPAFVLAEVARVQITPFIGITFLDFVIGLFACIYLFKFREQKQINIPIVKPILFVIAAFILSLVLNSFVLQIDQLFYSSLYLFRWSAYALFLIYALNLQKSIKKNTIQKYLLIVGTGIVVLGLIQFLFFKDLKVLFFLGWDDHLYRLFSTFLDPNFAGMYLVLFLIFQLPLINNVVKAKTVISRLFFFLLFILTTLAIFLTYSRTAYSMAIIGVLTYFILSHKKIYGLIAVIVVIVGIGIFSNTKIEGLNPFRTASTYARVDSIKNAVNIIQENPVFGVGFNAYRYAQIRYGFREEVTRYPTHADSGTDNSFLFLFATTGIVGFVAYIYFLYKLFKTVYVKKSVFRITFLSSLVSWMIGSLFINGLFYPEMMFWMWSLYAITQE